MVEQDRVGCLSEISLESAPGPMHVRMREVAPQRLRMLCREPPAEGADPTVGLWFMKHQSIPRLEFVSRCEVGKALKDKRFGVRDIIQPAPVAAGVGPNPLAPVRAPVFKAEWFRERLNHRGKRRIGEDPAQPSLPSLIGTWGGLALVW
jgi:hypothetical protein